MKEDFLKNDFINSPELSAIHSLFEKSRHAVCFHGETKKNVGKRLKKFHLLPHFEQFMEILSIFQVLATTDEQSLLHPKPFENLYNRKEQMRIKELYKFIEDNYQRSITITEAAQLTNLTNAAFCRYFKKMTRLTFTEFLNQYRIDQAKKLLFIDKNVTETCYECGFESLSYFNRIFKKVVGENPMVFKKYHHQKLNYNILLESMSNINVSEKGKKYDAVEMLTAGGCKNVKSYDNNATLGGSIHEMGIARMGNDPKTSVLNAHNQVYNCKNIFVTDGSAMVSTGSVNPSLTYMALTARAVDFAVSALKKGEL